MAMVPSGVLQAVLRLVLDRRARRLLLHARLEAAALDHEAVDDAVEDRAVVEAVLDVLEEVGSGLRRLLGIQFDEDRALVGLHLDDRIGGEGGEAQKQADGQREQLLHCGFSLKREGAYAPPS
jgi:hypothetical protein